MNHKVQSPWHNITGLPTQSFTCGHCGENVASDRGYQTNAGAGGPAFIYICHACNQPSYFLKPEGRQIPGAAFGEEVMYLPVDIEALYREARNCVSVSAYTAAVLICRKLLMNVAVNLNAPTNQKFIEYVEYLATKGYVPPNARGWVDHIRKKSNEANHEIQLMSLTDAEELINLTEMLLKIIYEFPKRVPGTTPTTTP
jgi:hypothetical protein